MKFSEYDKSKLVHFVAAQFSELAVELGSQGRAQAVQKIFQEQLQPRLQAWKAADPELYSRVSTASWLIAGDGEEKYPVEPALPSLNGITSDHGGRWGYYGTKQDIWITEKMVFDNLPPDAKIKGEKAMTLKEQEERVRGQLDEYLKEFTHPGQLSFSFPQLHTLYCMMQNRQIKPQKRPRFFKKPSEELKTLVLQAMVLAQAKGRS